MCKPTNTLLTPTFPISVNYPTKTKSLCLYVIEPGRPKSTIFVKYSSQDPTVLWFLFQMIFRLGNLLHLL